MRKAVPLLSLLLAYSSLGHAVMNGKSADAKSSTQSVKIRIDGGSLECTGVIIGRHLLLTAGHCTEGVTEKAPGIKVSNRLDGMSGEELHVFHWATAPGYRVEKVENPKGLFARLFSKEELEKKSGSEIQFDLAYLVIQEDLVQVFRLGIEQVPILIGDETSLQWALGATQAVAVGYGYGIYWGSQSGLKKQLKMHVQAFPQTNTLKAHSLENDVGRCHGDSGGGVFLKARPQGPLFLTGILSGITPDVACGSAQSSAVYVNLAPHLCWIQKDSGIALGNLTCDP